MRSRYVQALSLAALCSPVAWAAQVQNPNLRLPASAAGHRQAVQQIFTESYSAYKKFAFGHDQLLPLSQSFEDPRNGWGATIVDAMTTMSIMGLDDLFNEALNFTKTIDFSKSQTSDTISLFESTIRYVGGLISAFELSGKKFPFLISQATVLADLLSVGFSEGNTVPFGFVDSSGDNNVPVLQTSNIAEAGTLTLEWSKLSDYTGNATYRKLVEGSVLKIASNPAPLPGLPAQGIDPSTGSPIGGYVTWGGGSDSYFEQAHVLFAANTWTSAAYSLHQPLTVRRTKSTSMRPLHALSLLLAAVSASAAQLTLKTPRFAVLGPDGSQLRSETLSLEQQAEKPVVVGPKETLKLSFQVALKGSDSGVQPHQTFLRFYDETTGEEGIQPIKVSSAGKGKFEIWPAPPPSLPPSGDAPLKVSLLLGSFVHSPAKFDLFDLVVPASLPVPKHAEAASFSSLPEVQHTFRPEQKVPPRFISLVFTGVVLSPWLVLLGLWAAVRPRAPRLFSPSILPFTSSLVLIEGLLLWYWVELRLGQILLYGTGAAIFAALTGKQALASIGERRVARK